jgi:phenylpyruvate tautomerase PptA (4-oxalocrotonate tautomerase family)
MPILKLETSVPLTEEKQKAMLAALGKLVAGTIGKPEQYVMVTCGPTAIRMAGRDGDAAFVDIRSIGGLTNAVNRKLSAQVCQLLVDALSIPANRVYLNFTEIDAANWGWNGNTFG